MSTEHLSRGALLAIEGLLHQVAKAESEVSRLTATLRSHREARVDALKEVRRLRSAIERAHADAQRAIEHPFYSSAPLFAAAQTLHEALVAPASLPPSVGAKVCTWTLDRRTVHGPVYVADCGHLAYGRQAPGTCPSCGLAVEHVP